MVNLEEKMPVPFELKEYGVTVFPYLSMPEIDGVITDVITALKNEPTKENPKPEPITPTTKDVLITSYIVAICMPEVTKIEGLTQEMIRYSGLWDDFIQHAPRVKEAIHFINQEVDKAFGIERATVNLLNQATKTLKHFTSNQKIKKMMKNLPQKVENLVEAANASSK